MGGAVTAAEALVRALRDPGASAGFDAPTWTGVLTAARAEQLIGSLAHRVAGLPLPPAVEAILADARDAAEQGRTQALWEAEMARRALAPLGVPVVLLKGTAYVAAGLAAGQGRSIGDLDILMLRDSLDMAERALLAAGWEWVKPDPYDDAYYRRWMHELPPLIHRERDRMIDVHHTILPLTARPRPDAARLVADAEPLANGLAVLSPADMIVHAAAHLIADGDLAGGLRNLWDIDRLVREFVEDDAGFCRSVLERARLHDLLGPTRRALRLAGQLYGTPVLAERERSSDRLFRRRVLARDGWGRQTRPATRLAFYVRSHALRMPPAMLARHLWIKWRRGSASGAHSTPATG
jgi:hypothetical protein